MSIRTGLALAALILTLSSFGCGGGSKGITASTATKSNFFVANGKSINGAVVNMTAAITPVQAAATAIGAQPGTAGITELGDENGVAVYDVHITSVDGKMYEVKIDANSGKYLKTDLVTGTEGIEGLIAADLDGIAGPNDQH